jgi:protein involved in polysaccharide export with SLBB domain
MKSDVIARSVATKQSQLSSPRKWGHILWIPVFAGMTLFFTLTAFADESAKPSDFAQPKAAVPENSSVPARTPAAAAALSVETTALISQAGGYKIGVDDILDIAILQPEQMALTVTVSPDGSITFPYIGKVDVKGKTPAEIQDEIQKRLADGYLKYPLASVSLKQSQSKKFYVYGEVLRPGTYLLEDNMTALKAISTAGGFTKYGSSSRVKILRPKKEGAGYELIKINMKLIMNGSETDVIIEPGDIVQIEEGVF